MLKEIKSSDFKTITNKNVYNVNKYRMLKSNISLFGNNYKTLNNF